MNLALKILPHFKINLGLISEEWVELDPMGSMSCSILLRPYIRADCYPLHYTLGLKPFVHYTHTHTQDTLNYIRTNIRIKNRLLQTCMDLTNTKSGSFKQEHHQTNRNRDKQTWTGSNKQEHGQTNRNMTKQTGTVKQTGTGSNKQE